MGDLNKIKFLVLDVDGTLTDGGVYITEQGTQFKKFNARDGLGMKEAMRHGIEVGIISHSLSTEMIDVRANMLGIRYYYVGQRDKLEVLEDWIVTMQLNFDQVAFIGDDINDLSVMAKAGISACPADSIDHIKSVADIVLENKGGNGAVREFIDKYLLNNRK